MSTTTTTPIATNNDDSFGTYEGSSWPPTTTWTDSPSLDELDVAKSNYGNYVCRNVFLRFDTSFLGASAEIVSASLKVVFLQKSIINAGYKMVGDYYDFGGAPSISADYILTASPSIFTAVNPPDITENVEHVITLNDLTGINKTGYTGIRLTLDAGGAQPTGENQLKIAALEHATLAEPKLEIVWNSGVTLDTCLPDADIATTGWSTAPLYSKVNDSSDATAIQATAS